MRKLPLERVEELVEDSVFHPSPCKRHRERVLKSAVQAAVRQKISRRMIVSASAAALVLGVGIFIIRMATTSGGSGSSTAIPAGAPSVQGQTVPSSAAAAAPGSMGEGLYRSADPTDAPPEASKGL